MRSHAFAGQNMHILLESFDGDLVQLLAAVEEGGDPDAIVRSVCLQVIYGYHALNCIVGGFARRGGPRVLAGGWRSRDSKNLYKTPGKHFCTRQENVRAG